MYSFPFVDGIERRRHPLPPPPPPPPPSRERERRESGDCRKERKERERVADALRVSIPLIEILPTRTWKGGGGGATVRAREERGEFHKTGELDFFNAATD